MTRRDDPEPCVLMVVTDLDITVASVDDMKPTLADMKAKLVACDRPAECQRIGRHKHRKAKRHDHDSV